MKFQDWDTTNPRIQDWQKWLGSQDSAFWDCSH